MESTRSSRLFKLRSCIHLGTSNAFDNKNTYDNGAGQDEKKKPEKSRIVYYVTGDADDATVRLAQGRECHLIRTAKRVYYFIHANDEKERVAKSFTFFLFS